MEKGLSSITTASITLVLLSIVTAICIYGLNDRKLMAANIENAISKELIHSLSGVHTPKVMT